jgi:hypothetical protein
MIRFDVDDMSRKGKVGASLSKYGIEYQGLIDFSGQMVLRKIHPNGLVEELGRESFDVKGCGRSFRFANVDHKLILEIGGERLEKKMGAGRDAMGDNPDNKESQAKKHRTGRRAMEGNSDKKGPHAKILGSGKVRIRHVGLYRDIHYLDFTVFTLKDGSKVLPVIERANNEPFKLIENQFFVLGDNTPASLDCRWWSEPGTGNAGHEYREGTVPRDYLVGKAFFVYWPGPFKPFNDKAFAKRMGRILKILLNVPYVDGMKIIDGGV